jgi:hypothetical protein
MASKSIQKWCADREISRGMFYRLDAAGKAPKTVYIGTRRMITDEADAEWERSLPTERLHRRGGARSPVAAEAETLT